MTNIRSPAVAGLFYPDDPSVLRRMIDEFLAEAQPTGAVPKAMIAPHAGYIYSGPVAATAYAQLAPARDTIKRVVLLGPSHRVPFYGLALSGADFFTTPLGAVPIDREAAESIHALPQVQVLDAPHSMEHSLEVHLPFLQAVLADFKLVPLVVGEASPAEVAEVLDRLWGGPETLIVVSSDLSHYHDYQTARRMDQETSDHIEALAAADIDPEHACGCRPVNGLIQAAREHGLHASILDLRSSGDTAGPRDQVVGYGAYAIG
jgi:AmmeMemoRadiSam system protein B